MQTNILWSGIEYYSLENCIINAGAKGIAVYSTLIGFYQDKIYQVEYQLQLDACWNISSCRIHSQDGNKYETIDLVKKEIGWFLNGTHHPEFDACLDVDIPLTPLTNSLPINRLQWAPNQEQVIEVIYIDVLEGKIKPVKQKYKNISKGFYHYENIPNDFEAVIQVDEAGFVIDYPKLFSRRAWVTSHYPSIDRSGVN